MASRRKDPWMYFSYCNCNGYEMHETKQEAIDRAQSSIDEACETAEDGWPDDIEQVCWGIIMQSAAQANFRETPEGTFDFHCDYVLVDTCSEDTQCHPV